MFQIGWMEVNPLSLGCIWLKGVFRECHCSRSRARTGGHFISPVTTAASFHMLWIMWWWKLVQNQDGNHSGTMDKLTTTTTTTKTLIRGAVPKSILHTTKWTKQLYATYPRQIGYRSRFGNFQGLNSLLHLALTSQSQQQSHSLSQYTHTCAHTHTWQSLHFIVKQPALPIVAVQRRACHNRFAGS